MMPRPNYFRVLVRVAFWSVRVHLMLQMERNQKFHIEGNTMKALKISSRSYIFSKIHEEDVQISLFSFKMTFR